MRRYAFTTVDVFTDRRFGGNPLAVLTDARGLSDAEMQAIAAEFNLSETTFVLPPDDPANTAGVRIFHRTAEMPFAGHPNVGTAYVLAAAGRAPGGVLRFEELSGLVEVRVSYGSDGRPAGATITAPQPLQTGQALPVGVVAACAGIARADVVVDGHAPVSASVGVPFILAEVRPEALARAAPDVTAFRRALADHSWLAGRLSLHLYTRTNEGVRARMFAPAAGTFEDPATGSANLALGALLLRLDGGDARELAVVQGVEMGRPSRLAVSVRRTAAGLVASVTGGCVPVMSGEMLV
jgi:trans-2,3-dihydro-3-hydroxyanthranilate isomerase